MTKARTVGFALPHWRKFVATVTIGVMSGSLALPVSSAAAEAAEPAVYEPTWESVNEHDASPDWFKDAKFGVYWHWGAFSVPAYAYEWYPRHMYFEGSNENTHHKAVFGDPRDVTTNGFGYDKFITGGTDRNGNEVQFAPQLKSEGGQFDPAAWAALIKQSGAQFAGPVAEHHDGYSMWDSGVNEWNSVDQGPNLDLMKIFRDEIGKQDLKYMVAMHHAYNYNGFFGAAPQQPTDSLKKLFGQLPRQQEDQLWFDKLKEVVDQAQPDMIWQDFGLDMKGIPEAGPCGLIDGERACKVDEEQRLKFLSYYFNKGEEWGKDVVATYKHFDKGFSNQSAVEDYERGGPADIVYPYWLTDDSVSAGSWSYVNGLSYYTSTQMIHSLMDRVSKNGNLLLNIAPKADGSIPQQQQDLLRSIGDYLARNGEAVYDTRAWDLYGEGPTKVGGGSFTAPMTGTAKDIRYTVSKDDSKLYATVLGWPGSNATVDLTSLSSRSANLAGLTGVKLFGAKAGDRLDLSYTQDGSGLHVRLPANAPVQSSAYVIELSFDGGVPVPSSATNVALYDAADGIGRGAAVKAGSYTAEQLTERGIDPTMIGSLRTGANTRVETFTSPDLTGTPTVYNAGTATATTAPVGSVRVSNALSGEYAVTAVANGLRWDSNGASAGGAPVAQNSASDSANQKWRFEETDSGYVRIVNVATGRSIESVTANRGDATQLRDTVADKAGQQWLPILTDGTYVFQNRANAGLVLDSGGSVSAGSPLKQWDNGGHPNFRFTLNAVSSPLSGTVSINSTVNGLAVNVSDAAANGSTVVQQQAASGDTGQQFRFAATDSGFYKITHAASGRVIESTSTERGTAVQLRDVAANRPSQEWQPVAVGDAYRFRNRANANLFLDSGGRVTAGSPLKQWNDDGSPNLRFTLAPVSAEVRLEATSDASREYGTPGTMAVTVAGSKGTATGTVSVSTAGTSLAGPATLQNGAATLTVPGDALPPGTHQLRLSYSGDANYAPALATVSVTVTEAPASPVTSTATSRCIAGKVTLTTTSTNTGTTPVEVVVRSQWGTKTHASLEAGKSATVAFSTRATSIPAGTVEVSSKPVGSRAAAVSNKATFDARSCG